MRRFVIFLLIASWMACNNTPQGEQTNTGTDSLGAYQIEDLPGSDLKRASRKGPEGFVVEEGFLKKGEKTGTWVSYDNGPEFPSKVMTYVDGVVQGIYLELSDRGQIELKANYKNNRLDGPWGQYKFGRPTITAQYRDGVLDGIYREYYLRDGKIQKEIHYLNGKQHGPYRVFNEEGQVTLEYEYRDGEKVSGGIVETGNANEPE